MEVVVVLLVSKLQLGSDDRSNAIFVIVVGDLLDFQLFDGCGIEIDYVTVFVDSASFVVGRVK